MYSLPREIHQEIVGWLGPETQQITRLISRYWAGLIQPADVNLLKFGAIHNIVEYCMIGLSRGYWTNTVCDISAKYGSLDVLKWARAQGCPWGSWTCTLAAKYGHFETLKWARTHGCEWSENTCSWAACCGHLEILQWLRKHGCPWNQWACIDAARYGQLEILKWAHENGCPWNIYAADITEFPPHIQNYVIKLRG